MDSNEFGDVPQRPADLELTVDGFTFPVHRAHNARNRRAYLRRLLIQAFIGLVIAAVLALGYGAHWTKIAVWLTYPLILVTTAEFVLRLLVFEREFVLELHGRRLRMLAQGRVLAEAPLEDVVWIESTLHLGDTSFTLARPDHELAWIRACLDAMNGTPQGSASDVPEPLRRRQAEPK